MTSYSADSHYKRLLCRNRKQTGKRFCAIQELRERPTRSAIQGTTSKLHAFESEQSGSERSNVVIVRIESAP